MSRGERSGMGERSVQKKQLILEKAKEVFVEKGFRNVTMKDIVDACRTGDAGEICKVVSEHYMRTITRLMKEQGVKEDEVPFSRDFLL